MISLSKFLCMYVKKKPVLFLINVEQIFFFLVNIISWPPITEPKRIGEKINPLTIHYQGERGGLRSEPVRILRNSCSEENKEKT